MSRFGALCHASALVSVGCACCQRPMSSGKTGVRIFQAETCFPKNARLNVEREEVGEPHAFFECTAGKKISALLPLDQ